MTYMYCVLCILTIHACVHVWFCVRVFVCVLCAYMLGIYYAFKVH